MVGFVVSVEVGEEDTGGGGRCHPSWTSQRNVVEGGRVGGSGGTGQAEDRENYYGDQRFRFVYSDRSRRNRGPTTTQPDVEHPGGRRNFVRVDRRS